MIAEVADPILVAIVALGGTVVGGLLTGGVQVLVTRMTRSGQVELLQLQAKQEEDRVWRDRHAQIYADFLSLTASTIELLYLYAESPSEAQDQSAFPDLRAIREAQDALNRAYSELTLIAGPDVRGVTYRVLRMVNDAYLAALAKGEMPGRLADLSDDAVVIAMQKELGLHQRAASTPAPSP